MVGFSVATTKTAGQQIFAPSAFVALLLDPGPGMDKKSGSGIRKKHTGSATLVDIKC
jgi:hypothetical protein